MLHRMGLYTLRKVRDCLDEVEETAQKGDAESFSKAVDALDAAVDGLVRVANSLRRGETDAEGGMVRT